MPHKRNPEGSEHLDTLSRLIRANAAVLVEGMVVGHERDGRGWKAEWVALPEVCLLTGVALQVARRLTSGLVVDVEAMHANLTRHGDQLASERLLVGLAGRLGKHAAQELMHQSLEPGAARRPRSGRCGRGRRGRHPAGVRGVDRRVGGGYRGGHGRRRRKPCPRRAPYGTAVVGVTVPGSQGDPAPRICLAVLPTPLVRARGLERVLACGPHLSQTRRPHRLRCLRKQGAAAGIPDR